MGACRTESGLHQRRRSDHCGFHYRTCLISEISRLCQCQDVHLNFRENISPTHWTSSSVRLVEKKTSNCLIKKVIQDELQYIQQLIQQYPIHESMWMYIRFLSFQHIYLCYHRNDVEKLHQFYQENCIDFITPLLMTTHTHKDQTNIYALKYQKWVLSLLKVIDMVPKENEQDDVILRDKIYQYEVIHLPHLTPVRQYTL